MRPHFFLAYLALGSILLSGPHGLDRTEPEARINGQTALPWPSERCMDHSRAFNQGCELKQNNCGHNVVVAAVCGTDLAAPLSSLPGSCSWKSLWP